MGVVGKIIGGVVGPLVGGILGKPKIPKPEAPLPTATPRANSVVADAIARRRGSADNQKTGQGGAESAARAKKQLMGQ